MLYPVRVGILGIFLTPKMSSPMCPSLNSHRTHTLALPKQLDGVNSFRLNWLQEKLVSFTGQFCLLCPKSIGPDAIQSAASYCPGVRSL